MPAYHIPAMWRCPNRVGGQKSAASQPPVEACFGSDSDLAAACWQVSFTSMSRHWSPSLEGPRSATTGLMHRSNPLRLLDHLIGAAEQRERDGQAEGLDQLDFHRLLDRQVGWPSISRQPFLT